MTHPKKERKGRKSQLPGLAQETQKSKKGWSLGQSHMKKGLGLKLEAYLNLVEMNTTAITVIF